MPINVKMGETKNRVKIIKQYALFNFTKRKQIDELYDWRINCILRCLKNQIKIINFEFREAAARLPELLMFLGIKFRCQLEKICNSFH